MTEYWRSSVRLGRWRRLRSSPLPRSGVKFNYLTQRHEDGLFFVPLCLCVIHILDSGFAGFAL
jgi:hypothetical protein